MQEEQVKQSDGPFVEGASPDTSTASAPSITIALTVNAQQQVDDMTFLGANNHWLRDASSNTQEVAGDQDDAVEMETPHVAYQYDHAKHVGRALLPQGIQTWSSLGEPSVGLVEYQETLA